MAPAPAPTLPTVKSLGITPPKDVDPAKISGERLENFQTAISPPPGGNIDVDKALDLFQPGAFWRVILVPRRSEPSSEIESLTPPFTVRRA